MSDDKLDGWVILEVMGHRRMAGHAREVLLAGGQFIRIEIPGRDGKIRLTQYYRPESVYCLTPVSEEEGKRVAAALDPTHESPPQLTAGDAGDGDPDREPEERDDAQGEIRW